MLKIITIVLSLFLLTGFSTCQSRSSGSSDPDIPIGQFPKEAANNCHNETNYPSLIYHPDHDNNTKLINCSTANYNSTNEIKNISSVLTTTPSVSTASQSNCGSWRNILIDHIKSSAPNLIRGTSDVTEFCPQFYSLNTDQRAEFWASFILEVSRHESGFNTKSVYYESFGDGNGSQQVSQGLLQLSYSDASSYHYLSSCREISWQKDQYKSENDPTKTIFNPSINLRCGVEIMNRLAQLTNKVAISDSKKKYWEVLDPTSGETQVPAIRGYTSRMPICSQTKASMTARN